MKTRTFQVNSVGTKPIDVATRMNRAEFFSVRLEIGRVFILEELGWDDTEETILKFSPGNGMIEIEDVLSESMKKRIAERQCEGQTMPGYDNGGTVDKIIYGNSLTDEEFLLLAYAALDQVGDSDLSEAVKERIAERQQEVNADE